jgi:hypothetical protein
VAAGAAVKALSAGPARGAALGLLALLLAVYGLSYAGTFITDDEHILAARALGLAFEGDMHDGRVLGNSRVHALSSLPGEQAAQATGIEPGQVLLGAGLARLSLVLGGGRVQTLFLLNLWVTALTALLVFQMARALGSSVRGALVTALLFGLGSQAWPYARTYFRDPLAALFLAFAWWQALRLAGGQGRAWPAWLGLLAGLLAGMLTKNTVTLALPALAWLALSGPRSAWKRPGIWKPAALAALALGLLVLAAGALAAGPLARFTPGYYAFLLGFFFGTPHPHLGQALLGPFISPGKSLFLYSPVLLLALAALPRGWRLAGPAWLYLLLLVAGQALFYDADWWGHVNWGLRFLVPALPPLMACAAPLVEGWLRSSGGRWLLVSLGLLGALVQLAGLLAPVRDYYLAVVAVAPDAPGTLGLWTFEHSALRWHFGYLFSGRPWDPALVRLWPAAAPLAAGLLLAGGLAVLGWRRSGPAWLPAAVLLLACGLTLALPAALAGDPAYGPDRADLSAARTELESAAAPGDLLLLKAYASPAWYHWMNWSGPSPAWVSLPFQAGGPGGAPDPVSARALEQAAGAGGRIWLLLPCDALGVERGLEAAWLDSLGTRLDERVYIEGDCVTRLLLYDLRLED